MSDPRAGVPNMELQPITPQGGTLGLVISPSSSVSLARHTGPNQISPPPFPPDSMRILLYSLDRRTAVLLVPRSISATVVLYVVVVVMCS